MLVLVTLVAPASAQSFLDPLPAPMGSEGTAVLTDGSTVQGDPRITFKGMGSIKKLSLELPDGTKTKLAASDVTEFRLVPGGLAKVLGASEGMSSITEMAKTHPADAMGRTEVIFVSGQLPNGKPALMQLLNPGFDSTMQVFVDPAGRQTARVGIGGVPVTGGALNSYLVLKKGQTQAILVKKGQYDELWDTLYGDCAAMTKPEKPDFDTMAADVTKHAESCGATPTP